MLAKNQKFVLGLIVILVGLLILVNNLHLLELESSFFWGLAFAILGLIFLNVYRQQRHKKGPLVVGLILIFLALIMVLDSFAIVTGDLIGSLFFWGVGSFFISIFIKNNGHWWAVIPGGIFLVLGFIVLIDAFNILDEEVFGFIFIFGLSLIFWFLYLIKDEKNKLTWAGIVAMLLTVLSFFVLKNEMDTDLANILFPISIIISGVFVIFRGIKPQNKSR